MHDDDDLRARFRALADEAAAATPPLTPIRAAARKKPWYAPRRLAVLGASLAAALLILSIGLVLGTSTGYASARVEGERERHEIAATTDGVSRQLGALNLALLRTRAALAQLAVEKGASAQTSLSAAEAEVDSMRASVARIAVNLTNHAAAGAPSRPAFAILSRIPMKNALTALSCVAILSQPPVATARQGIPVVDLPPAAAKTTQTLGAVLTTHEAPDGKVLVNDGGRRQLTLFDSTLAGATTVLDSLPGTSATYGSYASTLIPYVGDSLLFPDFNSRALLVLDSHGHVVRSLALPNAQHLRNIGREASATDNKGRLIYRGNWAPGRSSGGSVPTFSDSVPLLRADFDLRRVDTIGQIARPVAKAVGRTPDGRTVTTLAVDPLAAVDDWAVLSDGSLAMVRGRDYHIDWVRPNGTSVSTPKLPFDWKRVSDEDKRRLADSTQEAIFAGLANGSSLPVDVNPNAQPAGAGGRSGGGGGGAGGGGGGGDGVEAKTIIPRPADVIPADKLPDFYPPLRLGATLADLDDNLWILPRTSAQSQHGELVYDVVNAKGEMVRRVRIPLGRLIVGFGKGGVVYMTSGDKATGFYLERSRLPAGGTTQPK